MGTSKNPTLSRTIAGISKASVGLDRVDNTSDADKVDATKNGPIYQALSLKQNILNPYNGFNVLSGTNILSLLANSPLSITQTPTTLTFNVDLSSYATTSNLTSGLTNKQDKLV